ncbi:DUF4905 domain-containing protein [Pontibacter locisalis]|uniref:DUF4905 domain-containing protein n=1 Tax=Pontibacter locisalis TaxID=1719035 RepID=A0ABW5IR88_9BACT
MWRIRLDTSAFNLALEIRDADLLLAYYFTLSASDFTIRQLPVPSAQAWWKGLEDTQEGVVYLHGYGDRKVGQHKGIIAMAAATGERIWEQPELAFYGVVADGVLAYPATAPEISFQLLHPRTGQPLKTGLRQQDAAEQAEAFSVRRYKNCTYPALYKEGEAYFEQVRDFLEAQLGIVPVKAVEYAETDAALVVSFYEDKGEAGLTNFVAVFNLEGDLQLKEKLGSGLSGIGSDTFFIFNLNLYFLQDKQILKVYRLLA